MWFSLLIACAPVEAPGGRWADVRDVRTGSLEGQVVDVGGDPIGAATVVSDPRGQEAVTDPDGRFRVGRLLPGRYWVVAAATGFQAAFSRPIDVAAGESADGLVVMLSVAEPPTPRVQVRVQGPAGAPLSGASVDVWSAGVPRTATTDPYGWARFDGVVTDGLPATVTVTGAPGTWSWTRSDIDIDPTGLTELAIQLSGRPSASSLAMGSFWCAACHPDASAHHADTRHADAASSTAPEIFPAFVAGWGIGLGGGARATLLRVGDDPAVRLEDGRGAVRTEFVAGWIGDPSQSAVPWAEIDGEAVPLPIAWVATDPARAALPEAAARIVPFEPERWLVGGDLTVPIPLERAQAACLGCHVTGFVATAREDGGVDMVRTAATGDDPRFNELGVGCEACHGPALDHILARADRKLWTITRPQLLAPADRDAVCAACHSGGESVASWPSGAARAPGQQADELEVSPHGSGALIGLACNDCHDPHGSSDLRESADDNALCVACHPQVDTVAHSRHVLADPAAVTASGRCVGCHMPRTATWTDFGAQTGAGRLASHLFVATPPADALAEFTAAGTDVLQPGAFPATTCQDCHAVANAFAGDLGSGPVGDPAQRATHAAHQRYFEGLFP